jgi:integrase
MGKLSDRRCQSAKPKGGRRSMLISDGHNLYLSVSKAVDGQISRSWIFRYSTGIKIKGKKGRERFREADMGLGSLSVIGLQRARELAREYREHLLAGRDPILERDKAKAKEKAETAKAKAAITFKQCAELFIKHHGKQWGNAQHARQWTQSLTDYAFPTLGHLPVASIDKALVLKVLDPIWPRVTETASRVRQRIEAILDFAKVRGYRPEDAPNPATWGGNLEHALPAKATITKEAHQPALPYARLFEFMTDLKARRGYAARAVEFLILTAMRTDAILGAKWGEVDLDAKVWTVPKERMKGGKREHRVPLAPAAVDLLKSLPRENDYLFPGYGNGGLSRMTLLKVIERMNEGRTIETGRYVDPKEIDAKSGEPREIVPHGFRSCFEDWAHETTPHANHVIEMALAHSIKNKSEAAYRRGDLIEQRSRLMVDWARFSVTPPATGNVVAMAARR